MRPGDGERRTCLLAGRERRPFPSFAELALHVTREDGMDRHGMYMSGLSMMRMGLRVNMEEGKCEQPQHRPPTQQVVDSRTLHGEESHERPHGEQTLSQAAHHIKQRYGSETGVTVTFSGNAPSSNAAFCRRQT